MYRGFGADVAIRIGSCGLPTTDLGLSGVDFTDRAVGTDSKSKSRHCPRLLQEFVSVYPHEMSLKPGQRPDGLPRIGDL